MSLLQFFMKNYVWWKGFSISESMDYNTVAIADNMVYFSKAFPWEAKRVEYVQILLQF